MIANFINGFGLGVSVAAPVGPVTIVILRTALAQGNLCAMAVATGAVTVDAVYLGLAIWGASTFGLPPMVRVVVSLVGSAVLFRTALNTYRASSNAGELRSAVDSSGASTAMPRRLHPLLESYGTGLLVTSTNPVPVMLWASIGTALASTHASVPDLTVTYAGVLAGVWSWATFAANFWAFVRGKVSPRALRAVNLVCAAVLLFYCVRMLLGGLSIATGRA
ncbi:MAG: LysE family transporter [Firmicutes bacterium]|nr:LysE family transporter [Bacillota bacterium]